MPIKLDMETAYGRLECDFIKKCIDDLGVCEKWTNWIMQCITTTAFRMILNEKTEIPFNLNEVFVTYFSLYLHYVRLRKIYPFYIN